MKTAICLLTLLVFTFSQASFAQEKTDLSGYWYLNENTGFEIGVYTDDLDEYYSIDYYFEEYDYNQLMLKVKGDRLQFYFLKEKESDNYSADEEPMDTIRKASFQILILNDSVFSLHPIDFEAVSFLDRIQHLDYSSELLKKRDDKFYKTYLKEVNDSKGNKRIGVLDKWKNEHHVDVDKVVFHEEKWYSETWDKWTDDSFIDSIYYSEMMVCNPKKDSVLYIDYKFYADSKYVMHKEHAKRSPNDGIPNVEYPKDRYENTVEFLPPVIRDDYQEDEEGISDYYLDGGDVIQEEIDESESMWTKVHDAEDGYYTGTIDEQWMYTLNEALAYYGPTKQVSLSDEKNALYCSGDSILYCGKKHMRVFYKGIYRDFWLSDDYEPLMLYEFMLEFTDKESYYLSLESLKNPKITFPLTFKHE